MKSLVVRGLWLLRQQRFAIDPKLPAARVSFEETGFLAHLPGADQTLPLSDFLAAAFTRRLHFGVPANLPAKAVINVGTISCWACGADTDILTMVAVTYGPHVYHFTVPELGEQPDLFAQVREHIPTDSGIGIIRARQSRTQNRAYLSKGCAHCDALIAPGWERSIECHAFRRGDRCRAGSPVGFSIHTRERACSADSPS